MFYETTFITNQDLTTKQVDDLVESLVSFLKNFKGKLVKKEYWGIKNFAYPIKKQKKGHYTMLCLDCSSEAICKLGEKLQAQEGVLKFLTIKVKEISKIR